MGNRYCVMSIFYNDGSAKSEIINEAKAAERWYVLATILG